MLYQVVLFFFLNYSEQIHRPFKEHLNQIGQKEQLLAKQNASISQMESFLKSVISFSGLYFGYRTQIQVKSFFTDLHASVKIGLAIDVISLGLKYMNDSVQSLKSHQGKQIQNTKPSCVAIIESPSQNKKILGTYQNAKFASNLQTGSQGSQKGKKSVNTLGTGGGSKRRA